MEFIKKKIVLLGFFLLVLSLLFGGCAQIEKEPIRVGVLHSLSGTMAISETAVKEATLMAIEEINANGGLLGRQIEPIVVDGASDWDTFAQKADSLIKKAQVQVVFGCWTSASRKTVKPVFEKYKHLLFYPVQYEGLEQSPHIVYTGAAPNQQIIPAVRWAMAEKKAKSFYLVGSDYVFPRTANAIIKDLLVALEGELAGESYLLLGSQDVEDIVADILEKKPDVVLNTINGDSNVAFFKALAAAGVQSEDMPVISFSIAEDELRAMPVELLEGHYAAWNYFQSVESVQNHKFIRNFKAKYGNDRVTDDPIEAGYFGVYLWAEAVKKADTPEVDKVRANLANLTFDAPGGLVYIDGETQHTWKSVRIGSIEKNGQFNIVWDSKKPVRPLPFPDTREVQVWNNFLEDMYFNWNRSWANPG
ncbi:MAG: urea ABC transporter substrate-binding protein [Bernardetiaceae bacterium]|nr:urea ABC transporter substrate-binding protein [Bernardetiaceae bacterium]